MTLGSLFDGIGGFPLAAIKYENLMPSILISNKHLKDDCSCPECLQNYVANDVISRIIESGQIMVFTGDDYRYKKREMRGD